MHLMGRDDQSRKSHRRSAARPRPDGSGRPSRSARGLILLPLAARPVRARRERGVDRQPHATCTLSTFLHCGDGRLPRLRVLARLPLIKNCVRRRSTLPPPHLLFTPPSPTSTSTHTS